MLLLTATTDKIQLITSTAANIDVHASYMDHTTATDNIVGGRTNTTIASAGATTDIVPVPTAGDIRNVKTLHIRNRHATLSCDVTVIYDQNSTDYQLHQQTLRPGETLEYIEGVGFFAILNQTSPTVRVSKLTADVSNATVTLAELTTMSLTTGLGTFHFRYAVVYQSPVATTGIRLSVNHSGTVSSFVANVHFADIIGTASSATPDQDSVLAAATVYGVFAARAKSTTGWGTTLSVDTAGADMLAIIEGLMTVTSDGDIELWHGSEVAAGTSTVKAGTGLILTRVGD